MRRLTAELTPGDECPWMRPASAPGSRGFPERQRLTVFLRYYADLDYRSIAHVLDVEVGTVSATLSSAHSASRSHRTPLEAPPNPVRAYITYGGDGQRLERFLTG